MTLPPPDVLATMGRKRLVLLARDAGHHVTNAMTKPQLLEVLGRERRCPECASGRHSICSGDFSTATVMTCRCAYCKRWVDEHGPFSVPVDET